MRAFVGSLFGAVLLVSANVAALAVDSPPQPTHVEASGGKGVFDVKAQQREERSGRSPQALRPPKGSSDQIVTIDACSLVGQHVCPGEMLCSDGKPQKQSYHLDAKNHRTDQHFFCPEPQNTGPTLVDVQTAFAQIPLPASPLHIQPPGGETLVNFDTIYFTDPTAIDKQITLLGATIDFHITAATYTWHYGDGQAQTTTDPGAAYPHQTITHRYLRKGTAAPSLDTTYQADYRINSGSWQHLGQTVTIAGPPQTITIRTATPHLVDSDG